MPRGDKTGPQGLGPRTGRGLGPCLSPEETKRIKEILKEIKDLSSRIKKLEEKIK